MHKSGKAHNMFCREVKKDKGVEIKSNKQRWGKGLTECQIQILVQYRGPSNASIALIFRKMGHSDYSKGLCGWKNTLARTVFCFCFLK